MSKIVEELIEATGYTFTDKLSVADNRVALAKAADRLHDAEWEKLSKEAQAYTTSVSKACKEKKPIPAPPDEAAPKKTAPKKTKAEEAAPKKTKAEKAKSKPKNEEVVVDIEDPEDPGDLEDLGDLPEEEEDLGDLPEEEGDLGDLPEEVGNVVTLRGKPLARPEKAGNAAEAAPKKKKVEKVERASDPRRGRTMYEFRRIMIENPDMKKSDVVAECANLGFPVTASTAHLIWYNTSHTIQVLRDLGKLSKDF